MLRKNSIAPGASFSICEMAHCAPFLRPVPTALTPVFTPDATMSAPADAPATTSLTIGLSPQVHSERCTVLEVSELTSLEVSGVVVVVADCSCGTDGP